MFVVTLTALPMPGVLGARLTVNPVGIDLSPVVLVVPAGGVASVNMFPTTSGFIFETTIQADGYPPSSMLVENVPSDGGLHVQMIGSQQLGGRPFGIGYIIHSYAQQAVVLVCKGPPPRRQSCPGSLTCDDYTLTC